MKRMEISQKKWIASMVGCAMIGSAMGSIGLSFADNLRSTSNILNNGVVLPYEGYLMLDSAPVNSQSQQVRFSLYESPSGGTAQWVEGQTVSVVNGKFAVALGANVNNKVSSSPANATFSDVILDAQKLYIGIEVMNDQGQFIELSGRQEIMPAPYAAWSARSADFKAEGDLTVEGVTRPQNGIIMRDDTSISGVDRIAGFNDLRFSGTATNGNDLLINSSGNVRAYKNFFVSGSSNLEGGVTVTGLSFLNGDVVASGNIDTNGHLDVHDTDILLGTANSRGRGDGGRAFSQYLNDTLYVNFAGDFTGGTVIDSSTRVTGNLRVDGGIDGIGIGYGSCTSHSTSCQTFGDASIVYLDRHNVSCSSDKVLRQWRLQRCPTSSSSSMKVDYQCCTMKLIDTP